MRGISGLPGTLHDIPLAWRALRRSPGFTAVTVTTLGMGLTLGGVTLAVVNAYLVRSLPYPEADRLYHVRYAPPGPVEPRGISALDWSAVGDVVEYAATSLGETYYLTDQGYSQTARGLRVSAGFLAATGVRPELGRSFTEGDFTAGAERVGLIGHSLWRARFGSDSGVVGRVLRVETETEGSQAESLRIVGVLAPGFWYGRDREDPVEVMVPLLSRARTYLARLREGVPAAEAERRLTEAVRRVATSIPPNWPGVELESVQERYVRGLRPMLWAMTGATGLVLLIVCANVGVLMLLRAIRRQKEVAVRVALGAGRGDIFRMLLAEAGLISGAALAVGLTIAATALRVLTPLIERHLGRPAPGGPPAIPLDPPVLLILGGAAAAMAILLSLVPMLAPGQRRLAVVLRQAGRGGSDGASMRRIRSSLIALEVAGSLALLVGSGLLIRSVASMMRTDLGFRTEHLVRVGVVFPARAYPDTPSRSAFYERLIRRMSALTASPAVMANWPPFAETPPFPVVGDGGEVPEAGAGVTGVGAGYFALLGIPLGQGREFTDHDRSGAEPVAVISQSLARRLWPEASALGRRIRVVDEPGTTTPSAVWRTIVGVAGDVRQTYRDEDQNDIYLSFAQVSPGRFGSFYIRSERPLPALLADLRGTLAETDPRVMIRGATTMASIDRELPRARFLTSLLTGFAAFALFLAVVGLYGVIAYAVRQREREVAIRIAIGATRSGVVGLFLKEGGMVLAAGIGGGMVGALALARLLHSQLHGVAAFDGWSFAAAGAVMAGAGLLAIWWPAQRAADANLMLTLNDS